VLAEREGVAITVLSGGVMQNQLLLSEIIEAIGSRSIQLWTNREGPPNDGGISLGQAALAIFTSI
jgi:hydrogenase maturation protein HypF